MINANQSIAAMINIHYNPITALMLFCHEPKGNLKYHISSLKPAGIEGTRDLH